MTERFEGNLEWIDPERLITKGEFKHLESFFLGLAVVFNDLKGLILFEHLLIESYERPTNDEVTSHAGNFGGVRVQLEKLIASTINEFFIFLKKNSFVLGTTEFKNISDQMAKADQQVWNGMIAAAHNKLPSVTDMLKAVVHVRSNIAFHYDHSGKVLRNAFISRFMSGLADKRTLMAYYSIGDTLAKTRFYFADAAVEESLYIAAGKQAGKDSKGDEALERYKSQLSDTVSLMNSTIAALMKCYIRIRRNEAR